MKRRSTKGYFITGLLIVVPAYITIYVLRVIAGFMDSITRALPDPIRPDRYLEYDIPGIGIAFTIVGIFIIGFLATNFLGNRLVALYERLLDKIPFLRSIYKGSKQFMETFFADDRDGFRSVVMVEYPRRGIFSLAFVTSRTRGEVQKRTQSNMINLFLPTTPNPTSGFYLVVPEEDVVKLDITVEDAFKIIMTGGMVVPSEKDKSIFEDDKKKK